MEVILKQNEWSGNLTMTHLLKTVKKLILTTETKCENRKEIRDEMGSKWANDVYVEKLQNK